MTNIFRSNAVLFSICTLIWGTTWIALIYQVHDMHVMLSVALRFAVAALMLGSFCLLKGISLKISLAQHKWVALSGIFIYTLDYSFLYAAQQYMISALLAVLSSSVIYFNVVLRRIVMGTPIRLEVVIGATVGLFGIIAIFLPEFEDIELEQGLVFGLLFASGSFLSAAFGNVVSEKVLQGKTSVLQLNFWGMLYGVLVTGTVAFIDGAELVWPDKSRYYIALIYLSAVGSVIAFAVYMKLIQQMGSDKAAYVVLVYPIVALIVSTFFEGYQWTYLSVFGVVLVLIGNAIAMGNPLQKLKKLT